MITGKLVFQGPTTYQTFQLINSRSITYPSNYPDLAKDLCDKLFVIDPEKRLVVPEIKNHPFYSEIDWDNLTSRPPPPFTEPKILPEEKRKNRKILHRKKN